MKPRILIIRGGAIGDFILTLPAIRLVREAFPDAHLEILGYKHIVALAEGRFYADAAMSIEYGPMAGFFNPRSELDPDLSQYFASFQQIVSYLYDPDGYFEANLRRAGARNVLKAFSAFNDDAHAAHQLARPLQSLALYLDDHAARVHPHEADRAAARQFLGEAADHGLVVAIHPGSGGAQKNWPTDRWVEVAKGVAADFPEARLLIVGGEADHEKLDFMAAALSGLQPLVARDLPLPQLAAVLERCRLFLGHDSGISHLAAAVGARCLLLFGPTDPEIWGPANAQVQTIQAPEGNLGQLTVDHVREAVRVMLP